MKENSYEGVAAGDCEKSLSVALLLAENQQKIVALHAENMELMRANPALFPPDILTLEEKLSFAQYDFRVDQMPLDILVPALQRLRLKGDGIPAYITHAEAQIIFGFRAISHGAFGELHVATSEKKRVAITVMIKGR